MARKIKIDNAELKRRTRQETRRKVGGRTERKYHLIVCEGEKTEPNYFLAWKRKLPRGVVEYIEIEGKGANTLSLVGQAERIRSRKEAARGRSFDFTWAVFDRDSFPSDHFDNAIHKCEQLKPPIRSIWSNEAFELWFLLHLEFVNTGMKREDYKSRIEQWLSSRMGIPFSYEKNRADMYEILQRYGNEAQAIKWAQQLEASHTGSRFSSHNPCTKVHLLIGELNKLIQ
ncbi:MAG: RloB domain-containing protein [Bacteroidetes bacterium]|nr:MAG: RloB domain-containing protein [Bacteroidota bacterium]